MRFALLGAILVVACGPSRPSRDEAQRILDGIDQLHAPSENFMWFSHARCDGSSGPDVRITLSETGPNSYDPESLRFVTALVDGGLVSDQREEQYCAVGVHNPPSSTCRRWGRMARLRRSDAVRCSGYQVKLIVGELGDPVVRSLEFPSDSRTTITYERRVILDEEALGVVTDFRSRFEGVVPTATDGRVGSVSLTRSDSGWNVGSVM